MTRDCIQENAVLDETGSKVCKATLTPTSEPADDGCKVGKVCKTGDRIKITADYPGSETLRGIEATVKEDLGKRGFEIEFDAEVEIIGGKPKKYLNVSDDFLTLIGRVCDWA